VEYKESRLNGDADMLSHREEDVATVHTISAPTFALFNKLHAEARDDPEVTAVRTQLKGGSLPSGGPNLMVWCSSRAKYSSQKLLHSGPRCCPMLTS
jgi:hypothetical protein